MASARPPKSRCNCRPAGVTGTPYAPAIARGATTLSSPNAAPAAPSAFASVCLDIPATACGMASSYYQEGRRSARSQPVLPPPCTRTNPPPTISVEGMAVGPCGIDLGRLLQEEPGGPVLHPALAW